MLKAHVLTQPYRQPIVTGTSVLGIRFQDGVMLAADNLGTSMSRRLTNADGSSFLRLPRAVQGHSTSTPPRRQHLPGSSR